MVLRNRGLNPPSGRHDDCLVCYVRNSSTGSELFCCGLLNAAGFVAVDYALDLEEEMLATRVC